MTEHLLISNKLLASKQASKQCWYQINSASAPCRLARMGISLYNAALWLVMYREIPIRAVYIPFGTVNPWFRNFVI